MTEQGIMAKVDPVLGIYALMVAVPVGAGLNRAVAAAADWLGQER